MDEYSSTYWLYKRETARFSEWLAHTALDLGYPVHRFTVQPESQGSPQSSPQSSPSTRNGAAEGGGKKTAASSGSANSTTNGEKSYILRMPQFVELARFLVEKGHRIAIETLQLLRSIIHRRVKCLDFFARQGGLEGHVFFVEVLLKTADVLSKCELVEATEPAVQEAVEQAVHSSPTSNAPTKRKTQNKKIKKKKLSSAFDREKPSDNVFSTLSVEEARDDADGDALALTAISGGKEPHSGGTSSKHIRFKVEDTIEEALYAFMAFYSDFYDLRNAVRQAWREFRANLIDLVTASVVTNTAFDLLERTHKDIMGRYQHLFQGTVHLVLELTDHVMMLKTGRGLCERDPKTGRVDVVKLRQTTNYPLLSSVGERFMLSSLANLQTHFSGQKRATSARTGKEGKHATLDASVAFKPGFDYDGLGSDKKTELHNRIVREALSDFAVFDIFSDAFDPDTGLRRDLGRESNDALVREISRCTSDGSPSLLLLFETAIYVCINEELREDARRGFLEARRYLKRMLRSIDEAGSMEDDIHSDPEARRMTRLLVDINAEDLACLLEEMGSCDNAFKTSWTISTNVPDWKRKQIRFLHRHPTYCGLLVFEGLMGYSHLVLHAANTSNAVVAAAHLYNACKQHSAGVMAERLSWPDMDLLIELQRPETIFSNGAKVPSTLTECCRSALSAFGYTDNLIAATLQPGSRRRGDVAKMLKETLIYPRGERMAIDSKVLSIFAGGKCSSQTCCVASRITRPMQANLDPEAIERLLRDVRSQKISSILAMKDSVKSRSVRDRDKPGSLTASAAAAAANSSGTFRYRGNRGKTVKDLSIVGLLRVIKAGLQFDMRLLQFDYLALQTQCLTVLHDVYDTFAVKLFGTDESVGGYRSFPKGAGLMKFVCNLLRASYERRQTLTLIQRRGSALSGTQGEVRSGLLLDIDAVLRAALEDMGDRSRICRKLRVPLVEFEGEEDIDDERSKEGGSANGGVDDGGGEQGHSKALTLIGAATKIPTGGGSGAGKGSNKGGKVKRSAVVTDDDALLDAYLYRMYDEFWGDSYGVLRGGYTSSPEKIEKK